MRYNSNVMFIKAIREIQAGEELTLTYVDLLMSYKERQDELKTKYCFICKC